TTGKDLREGPDALRDPFHESDDEGVCGEHLYEEERENGQDHLAAHVREERHKPEDDDVRGESVGEDLAGYHGLTAGGIGTRPRSPRTRSRGGLLRTSCCARRRRPRRPRRWTMPGNRAKSRSRPRRARSTPRGRSEQIAVPNEASRGPPSPD